MGLKERVYSVLLVSASESFNASLSALLPEALCSPVNCVSSVSAAKRAVAERTYDFVFINSPLPDESGTRFAVDCCGSGYTVVVLFARSELYAEIYDKVARHGVFTLQKPIAKQTMITALDWMRAARERLRGFEKKTLTIEEKMEEIRIVNHAKWLLISELKMSEPEAHRYIEKQAMDRCASRREIAEEIIHTYS